MAAGSCGGVYTTKAGVVLLQLGLNLDHVVGGEQAGVLDQLEADAERLHVVPDFLGGGRGEQVWVGGAAEQLVVSGDDVLDGRAVLGLLQAQGVDEDGMVGHARRQALQLGELAAGGGGGLEQGRGLEVRRLQAGQGLERRQVGHRG
jgi:hypothetical protein